MHVLVIEKDMGAKYVEDVGLSNSTHEKCLIYPDIPSVQGSDDTFMRGHAAGCYQGDSHWGLIVKMGVLLQERQNFQQIREGAFRERDFSFI